MTVTRPTAGIPRMARKQAADPHLRLYGLIDREQVLTPAGLEPLARASFTGGMTCNEADAALTRAGPGFPERAVGDGHARPTVRYLNVSAGPGGCYSAGSRCRGVILADRLEDAPIDVEQGGPWRLIIPEGKLYNSVKWVDAIEFAAFPNNSAERIAACAPGSRREMPPRPHRSPDALRASSHRLSS
ncbi:MAG: molybdopterin-dependent oxidoreductase [Thermomicrobiales bacterium]